MPCRSCPSVLDKAIHTIDEVRRTTPDVIPNEYDYTVIQAALTLLKERVIAELIRQGRWTGSA